MQTVQTLYVLQVVDIIVEKVHVLCEGGHRMNHEVQLQHQLVAFNHHAFATACIAVGINRQVELAAMLGVSRGVVADIVRGVVPRQDRRQRIAEILQVGEATLCLHSA